MANNVTKTINVTHMNVRESIAALIFRLVAIDLFTSFLVVVFAFVTGSPQVYSLVDGGLIPINIIFFGIVNVFNIILSMYVVIQWIEEYYEIFPDRLVHRRGFFFKKEASFSYIHIKSVELHQSLLGKLFNYGDVYLYDWELDTQVSMSMIHNPLKFLKILETLIPAADHNLDKFREFRAENTEEEDVEIVPQPQPLLRRGILQ